MGSDDINNTEAAPPRPEPSAPRSVVDDLGKLVREVLSFGTTVGTSVTQLDNHRETLDTVRKILEDIAESQKKANELKEAEERRLEARGGRDHEFRMRLLHGAGGLLTGFIVPAMMYYLTGWSPNQPFCPPPPPPPAIEVSHEPSP